MVISSLVSEVPCLTSGNFWQVKSQFGSQHYDSSLWVQELHFTAVHPIVVQFTTLDLVGVLFTEQLALLHSSFDASLD